VQLASSSSVAKEFMETVNKTFQILAVCHIYNTYTLCILLLFVYFGIDFV